jgi:hypothetical protein
MGKRDQSARDSGEGLYKTPIEKLLCRASPTSRSELSGCGLIAASDPSISGVGRSTSTPRVTRLHSEVDPFTLGDGHCRRANEAMVGTDRRRGTSAGSRD